MSALALVLLIAAVVFAVLRGLQVATRIDLGWLAVACVIAAVWMLPAIAAT